MNARTAAQSRAGDRTGTTDARVLPAQVEPVRGPGRAAPSSTTPAGRRPGSDALSAPGGYDTEGMDEAIAFITDPADLADLVSGALAEAYELFTERSQAARADPFGLTISALGGCVRQAAYRLAGTPPSDPDLATRGENRAANHGTWLDAGLVPLLAEVLGGQAQVKVSLTAGDQQIPGTADLVFARTVLDLKSVRESRLTKVIGSGAFPSNRVQGLAYALALHQQGEQIDWVVYLYLDRSSGTEHPVVERFDNAAIMVVLRRVWLIQSWRHRPDWAPRTERGPGHSWACDGCAWLRRCWGKDARPRIEGPQRRLARDLGAMAKVLADYQRLGTQAGEIKKEREFLKAIMRSGSRPGNYGDLRWYETRDGEEPDVGEMVQILQDLGIEPPMKAKKGQFRVGPAKRDEGPRAVGAGKTRTSAARKKTTGKTTGKAGKSSAKRAKKTPGAGAATSAANGNDSDETEKGTP